MHGLDVKKLHMLSFSDSDVHNYPSLGVDAGAGRPWSFGKTPLMWCDLWQHDNSDHSDNIDNSDSNDNGDSYNAVSNNSNTNNNQQIQHNSTIIDINIEIEDKPQLVLNSQKKWHSEQTLTMLQGT